MTDPWGNPVTAEDQLVERLGPESNGDATEGELVLDDVAAFLARFVAFPSTAAHVAVTLWIAHAHMVETFESSPRLALLSPEPGSGKTRVLEVAELLVPHPQHVLNASVAAIFRMIGKFRPTLLFDEVDTIFGRSRKGDDGAEDLRGLLNAGHRRSATIPRCVGPQHNVEHFPVFAACALAGLGDLPDTLMSRSVVVRMRRRAPHEHVESFRRRLVEPQGHAVRDDLGSWCRLVAEDCGDAWPEMPHGVVDRPADVWEPLLAIADAAGGHWPATARKACVALVAAAASADDQSVGVRLLGEIRECFRDNEDRLPGATLLSRLHEMDESPWGDWYGKPIDARWLANKLKPYGVSSRQIRMPGGSNLRGYYAEDFHDAWSRYLPGSATSATAATPQVTGTESVADGVAAADPLSATATGNATNSPPLSRDVADVADVALFGEEDGEADSPDPPCMHCGAPKEGHPDALHRYVPDEEY